MLDPKHIVDDFLGVSGNAVPSSRPGGGNRELNRQSGFVTLEQLLTEPAPETRWIVDGRLQAGGFSLFVARPKAGKSTNARELCLDVSRGEPWLGHETQKGRVLYCGFEEKRSEVAAHFKAMGATADDVRVYTDMPGPKFMQDLAREIEEHQPVLVVIDGLFRLIRVTDASDYVQMSRGLEPLLDLARRSGAHVMATHHSPKSDESADGVLGSTAIFGTVDCLLRIKKSDTGERSLSTVQRYGTDLADTILVLDRTTGRTYAGGLRVDGALARLSDAILRALPDGEMVREAALLDSVEGRRSMKIQALRLLREAGKVERVGRGGKGDSFRYRLFSSQFPTPGAEPGTGTQLSAVSGEVGEL